MNVEITGRHVAVTAAIRTYIEKRLKKFTKLLPEPINFHVILAVEKDRHTAEILLKTKLLDVTGTGETKDIYSSITRALEKLERQALKHKTRLIETRRHRAKAQSLAQKSGVPGGAPTEIRPRRVDGIEVEEARKKPMAVEEAVLELGQSECPFVVFRDVELGGVNVLYRRKDGSLALVRA